VIATRLRGPDGSHPHSGVPATRPGPRTTTRIIPTMTTERPDLYAILGITPHATQAEISHAYRALLRRHTRIPAPPLTNCTAPYPTRHSNKSSPPTQ
jgi:hypothetical protein